MLITDSALPVRMVGDAFMKQVSYKQTGDNLVVDAVKNKNWEKNGIIYIPANNLKSIKINNDAFVRSSSTLRVPILEILINGSCKVSLATLGKVILVENDSYEVDYHVRQIQLPNDLVLMRKE